jgi:hypothetical protein
MTDEKEKMMTGREVCSSMAALNRSAAQFGDDMAVHEHTVNVWRMNGVSGPAALLIQDKIDALNTYKIIEPKTDEDLGDWPGINADCAVASYLAFSGYDGRTLKMDGDRLNIAAGSGLETEIAKWMPRDWIRVFHGVRHKSRNFMRIEHDSLIMDEMFGERTTEATLRDWTVCIAYAVWPSGDRRRAKYFELVPSDEYQERIHLGEDWWIEGYFDVVVNENHQRRANEAYKVRKHEVRAMIVEE